MKIKKKNYTVSLSVELIKEAKKHAEFNFMYVSEFIQNAIIFYIDYSDNLIKKGKTTNKQSKKEML
jgi:hypothetical protein